MTDQWDIVHFVNGFLFMAIATLAWSNAQRSPGGLPWRGMAVFGFLYGAGEWLDMLAVGLGDPSLFGGVGFSLRTASLLVLMEFGRRGTGRGRLGGRRGELLPLTAGLAAAGGLVGIAAMLGTDRASAASHVALGLPAGLLAGWALWHEEADGRRWPLRTAGLGFALFGLVAGLVLPAAAAHPELLRNLAVLPGANNIPPHAFLAAGPAAASLGIWLVYSDNNALRGERAGPARWMVPILAASVVAGAWWGSNWFGQSADAEQRRELLTQAKAIARTIVPAEVKAVSFTAEDAACPQFHRLSKQLAAYAQVLGVRSLYTMALRDGQIVFGPESLAEDDPMASPPGTVYELPSSADMAAFAARRPATMRASCATQSASSVRPRRFRALRRGRS